MFSKHNDIDIFDACDLFVRGSFDKALTAFEEYYAVYPDSMTALNFMAEIYAAAGQTDKAEAIYLRMIDKLAEYNEFDRAMALAYKMKRVASDFSKPYRLIADMYFRKHRERLSASCLMDLAEKLRQQGRFNECADVYTQIADENRSNYKIISRVINRLIAVSNFRVMATVLQRSVNSSILPPAEVDNFIQHMIDAECKYEYVAPFMPDFIRRNPDKFKMAEKILLDMFRSGFDADLFTHIMSYVPLEDTAEFTEALMEHVTDKAVVKHMLRLAARGTDADKIKGLIMRMYVENYLDINEIYKISEESGNPVPMEEAVKIDMAAEPKNVAEGDKKLLNNLYAELGQTQTAMTAKAANPVMEPHALGEISAASEEEPEQHIDLADDFGVKTAVAEQPQAEAINGLERFEGFGDEPDNVQRVQTDDFFSDMPKAEETNETASAPELDKTEPEEASDKKKYDFFSHEVD